MLRWTDSCIMWLSISNSTLCILLLLLLWNSEASLWNITSCQPVYGLLNGWLLPLSLVFHLVKHPIFSCKTIHNTDSKSLFCFCWVFVSVTSPPTHGIAVCTLNLFFKTVNNVSPYCISVLLFDKLLTTVTCHFRLYIHIWAFPFCFHRVEHLFT